MSVKTLKQNLFEKEYMEKSWKEKKHQSYKKEDIDDSIIKFYKFLKLKKIKGTVLDVGCGNGKNTLFFERNGFEAIGIDFALSSIKICKGSAQKRKSKAKFFVTDILEYKSRKKFDIIIDCGCLHHIRKSYWKKYKNRIFKNIKPEGHYYLHGICDCKENKKLSKHPKNRNWIINNEGHYTHFFSLKEIKKEFESEFEVITYYKFKSQNSPLTIIAFYMQRKL